MTKKSIVPSVEENPIPDIAPITIDMHGVKKLSDNLDSHNATSTQLLKQLSPELSPALTMIFEASLQQCLVPSDWKTANIVPVHKKRNRSIVLPVIIALYH